MKPLVLGLSLLALLATGLLAQAAPQTQFFSLVGTFVVLVLLAAVGVTMLIAIVYLACFNTFGRGVIDRKFSLFMAWNLLRSHKRREPLTVRVYDRVASLAKRPPKARVADLMKAAVAGLLLWATTWNSLYNELSMGLSPAFAVTVQAVLIAVIGLYVLRAIPPTLLIWPFRAVATALRRSRTSPNKQSWLSKAFQARLTLQPFVSIVGVSLGIWALIVVLSVMRGFADDLQTKILRTNAHIIVEPENASGVLGDTYKLTDAIESVEGVKEVMAIAYGEVMMSSSTSIAVNVILKGMTDQDLQNSEQLQGAVSPGDVRWLSQPQALLSDRYRFPLQIDSRLSPPDDEDLKAPADDSATEDGETHKVKTKGPTDPKVGDVDPTDPFGNSAPNPRVYPGILLGSELARSLNVSVGSELQVISPDGDFGPTGLRPKLKSFRVAGIFTTGMYEYDQKLAYMALDDAQRFLNLDNNLNRVEVRVNDPEATPDIISSLGPLLDAHGSELRTMDWRERNKSLFAALALERIAMFIILGLTIIVAALSILSALTMIVVQRAKDIAVLKALGASNGSIVRTFLGIGAMIGFIATGTGLVIGLGFTLTIQLFGLPLPKEYYISTLPVAIEPMEVFVVALVAMAICMAATWYPARTASRLSPVEGFRHG